MCKLIFIRQSLLTTLSSNIERDNGMVVQVPGVGIWRVPEKNTPNPRNK